MTAVEVLRETRALIADPVRWTQNAFARDAADIAVDSYDESAVRWCSAGALNRVVRGQYDESAARACYSLEDAMDGSVTAFNDIHQHDQVIAAFDQAIAELETEELDAIPTGAPEPEKVLTPA